ncbi:MAG: hypothetical protein ACF8XB_16745 [Planctomycetota bacterium JB042]
MSPYARLGIGLVLVGLAGCQSTSDHDKMFRNDIDRESGWYQTKAYFKDVGLDFLDIFTLNVGAGKPGPYLMQYNFHATKYAEIGHGSWSGYKAGLLGRGFGIWREERHMGVIPAGGAGLGFANVLWAWFPTVSLGPIQNHYEDVCRIPYCGTKTLADKHLVARGYNINLDENRHWADIGASMHFLAVGLDVGVSPFEAFDWLFGFIGNYPNPDWIAGSDMPWDIGYDMADDDTRLSIYDDHLNRFRNNSYSLWPTIWPTTYGAHSEVEGGEWDHEPYRGPETGSFGGAWGGTHGTQH